MFDHPFQEFNSSRGLIIHIEYDHGMNHEKLGARPVPEYTELYEWHEEDHERLAESRKLNEN